MSSSPSRKPFTISRRHMAFGGMLASILLGLASRYWRAYLPDFLSLYLGDTLWGAMVYCGFATLLPNVKRVWLVPLALLFAFGIEFSQLYHAPWLDSIRRTTFGALVLGSGFLFSDLLCYSVGIAAACGIFSRAAGLAPAAHK